MPYNSLVELMPKINNREISTKRVTKASAGKPCSNCNFPTIKNNKKLKLSYAADKKRASTNNAHKKFQASSDRKSRSLKNYYANSIMFCVFL